MLRHYIKQGIVQMSGKQEAIIYSTLIMTQITNILCMYAYILQKCVSENNYFSGQAEFDPF